MRLPFALPIALAFLASSSCVIVASSPCANGFRDGAETDVDCGGPSCAACPSGLFCAIDADCKSGLCNLGVCGGATTCSDGVLDGTETDIDCGGASCPTCGNGFGCGVDADCTGGYCGVGALCVPPPPTGLPSTVGKDNYNIDNGAAIVISPGTQAGYGITASTGGSYRIVWTGDRGTSGTYRQFSGSVFTTGTIDSFTPGCAGQSCPLESNDIISNVISVSGGQRIDFDSVATTGIDGFDFTVTAEPAWFLLFIDGQPANADVFFSSAGAGASAATNPFGLTVN